MMLKNVLPFAAHIVSLISRYQLIILEKVGKDVSQEDSVSLECREEEER